MGAKPSDFYGRQDPARLAAQSRAWQQFQSADAPTRAKLVYSNPNAILSGAVKSGMSQAQANALLNMTAMNLFQPPGTAPSVPGSQQQGSLTPQPTPVGPPPTGPAGGPSGAPGGVGPGGGPSFPNPGGVGGGPGGGAGPGAGGGVPSQLPPLPDLPNGPGGVTPPLGGAPPPNRSFDPTQMLLALRQSSNFGRNRGMNAVQSSLPAWLASSMRASSGAAPS